MSSDDSSLNLDCKVGYFYIDIDFKNPDLISLFYYLVEERLKETGVKIIIFYDVFERERRILSIDYGFTSKFLVAV